MLCFHIGLPKTATTFLQRHVLPTIAGVDFAHKGADRGARRMMRRLRAHCQRGRRAADAYPQLVAQLRARLDAAAAADSCLLVSDENISMLVHGIWTGEGACPGAVAARLQGLAAALGPRAGAVRIIIGIRAQAPWLASRYAESAKVTAAARADIVFGQPDFERRVNALLEDPAPGGPRGWLDYAHVYDSFADRFGRANLLFLPLEAVAEMNTAAGAAHVAAFLGLSAPQAPPGTPPGTPPGPRPSNALAQGAGRWRLKSGHGLVELTPALEAAVAARFAAANAGLRDRTGLALP